MNAKSKVFIALLIVTVLWCLYVPENRKLAFIAMPQSSIVASAHTNVAQVWKERLTIPVLASALKTFTGFDSVELADDTGILWLVRLTTGKTTVAAFSECCGANNEPALFAASYGGWRGPILKFLMFTRWIPGLGRLELTDNGTPYLQLGSKKHPSDLRVGFALRDNVLFASLSRDADTVAILEARAMRSSVLASVFSDEEPWKNSAMSAHRFWVNGDAVNRFTGLPLFRTLKIDISQISGTRLSMTAAANTLSTIDAAVAKQRIKGTNAKASALAVDSAVAAVLLPGGLARYELGAALGLNEKPVRFDSCDVDDSVVYLTNKQYGMKILGLALPAITAVCPSLKLDESDILKISRRFLPKSSNPIVKKASTRDGQLYLLDVLGQFSPMLKASQASGFFAIEIDDAGDTVFCSSYGSLAAQRKSDQPESRPWSAWLNGLNTNDAFALAWIDVAGFTYELRQAASLARLATMLGKGLSLPLDASSLGDLTDFLECNESLLLGHVCMLFSIESPDSITLIVDILPDIK